MDLVQEKTAIISLGLKSMVVLGHILEGEGKTESWIAMCNQTRWMEYPKTLANIKSKCDFRKLHAEAGHLKMAW